MIDRFSLHRSSSRAAVLAVSSFFLLQSPSAFGGEEECGVQRIGRPVPQTRAEMGPNEFLWPRNGAGAFTFRPASNGTGEPYSIPGNRDSTSYITQTIPGSQSGHELFMDVARLEGNDDWLFVAYNAGVQVWDLRSDPANPSRSAFRDGWVGHFDEFPAAGEVDTYVEGIGVVESSGDIFIGLAGRSGHGFSFWEFNPPTSLVQHCQVSNLVARQVELIEHNNRAYAFVSASDGLYVYDLDSSQSGTCSFEGKVGTMTDGNYVSILQKDGDVFVASADGSLLGSDPLAVEIWEVDPENPGSARQLFSGFNTNSRGVALFEIPGAVSRYFLGFIESSNNLKFYDVESCLEHVGPGTCGSLGSPVATEPVDNIGKLYEFLDVSTSSDGRTWGYYGFMTSPGLFGSKFERLLDLTPLGSTSLQEAQSMGGVNLEEITDGGDTYNNSSPCSNSAPVDYWGDYYPLSRHGLNFLTPRHGIFIGSYFYRAAYSMLDIHQITNTPAVSSVTTSLDGGGSTIWMDETASYSAAPGGSCSPGAGNWCWVVETAGGASDVWSHSPDLGDCSASYSNPESFDYSCTPGGGNARCAAGTAVVTAWNTSCGSFPPTNTQSNSVMINIKDPAVDIEGGLDTGGTLYQQCQVVDMNASIGGRGPITWEWQVEGEPLDGCSGIVATASDLASVDLSCLWDTSGVQLVNIFADGFETGDVLRWSSALGLPALKADTRSGHRAFRGLDFGKGESPSLDLQVELVVSDGSVLDSEAVTITVEEIGEPSFVTPGDPTSATVVGNAATIMAPANDTSSWSWEIEDPDAGTAPCTFDGAASCVTTDTFIDTLVYAWTSDGSHRYEVSISNCQFGGSETASGSVSVSAAVNPVITTFRFNPSTATEFCCGSPFAGFECQSGVAIEFEVSMLEEAASYNFGFDWERTSQATATYAALSPDSSSLGTYSFTHTFSNSGSSRTVYPVVQVTSGLNTDVEDFYTSNDSITVLANGQTCN